MKKYFSTFHVVGEVADILLQNEPARKLLVDISQDRPGHEKSSFRKHPNRSSFTIFDRELIDQFLAEITIGCVIEVSGGFTQSNYVPHKTTYIDTVFTVDDFSVLRKSGHRTEAAERHSATKQMRPLH
ncbi:MAG: hypothetical protein ACI861_000860 [Paracoccaceae bacterium]|jgi:hypothetical protein